MRDAQDIGPTSAATVEAARSARTRRPTARTIALGTVMLCAVAAAGAALARSSWVSHQAALSFSVVPPTYAQLYFQQPQELPEAAVAGDQVSVPFVIANMGPSPRTYHYAAELTSSGGDVVIVRGGQVRVVRGGSDVVVATFTVPAGAAYFDVSLKEEPALIRFPFTSGASRAG